MTSLINFTIFFLLAISFSANAEKIQISEVQESEYSDFKFKQCKVIEGVVQHASITMKDICKYKLDRCDEKVKQWTKTTMYCISESPYECYKKDLWRAENPILKGFEDRKYPYVKQSPKRGNEGTNTEVCVYWK